MTRWADPQRLLERIWANTVIDPSGCVLWTRGRTSGGYAEVSINDQMHYVHRLHWELLVGTIPRGLVLDHRCHVQHCVSLDPDQLRLATNSINGQNRRALNANNTSGYRNVTWDASRQRWAVAVKVNHVKYHGGRFESLEAADRAARDLRAALMQT